MQEDNETFCAWAKDYRRPRRSFLGCVISLAEINQPSVSGGQYNGVAI